LFLMPNDAFLVFVIFFLLPDKSEISPLSYNAPYRLSKMA
jgi:hypothetical protein